MNATLLKLSPSTWVGTVVVVVGATKFSPSTALNAAVVDVDVDDVDVDVDVDVLVDVEEVDVDVDVGGSVVVVDVDVDVVVDVLVDVVVAGSGTVKQAPPALRFSLPPTALPPVSLA